MYMNFVHPLYLMSTSLNSVIIIVVGSKVFGVGLCKKDII